MAGSNQAAARPAQAIRPMPATPSSQQTEPAVPSKTLQACVAGSFAPASSFSTMPVALAQSAPTALGTSSMAARRHTKPAPDAIAPAAARVAPPDAASPAPLQHQPATKDVTLPDSTDLEHSTAAKSAAAPANPAQDALASGAAAAGNANAVSPRAAATNSTAAKRVFSRDTAGEPGATQHAKPGAGTQVAQPAAAWDFVIHTQSTEMAAPAATGPDTASASKTAPISAASQVPAGATADPATAAANPATPPAAAPPASAPAPQTHASANAAAPAPAAAPTSTDAAAAMQAAAVAQPPSPISSTATSAAHATTSASTQVAQAVSAIHIAPGANGTVTIHLQPADLGTVQVRIEHAQNGAATVTVQVEKPETLHTLQLDLPHLHQALDRAGRAGGGAAGHAAFSAGRWRPHANRSRP